MLLRKALTCCLLPLIICSIAQLVHSQMCPTIYMTKSRSSATSLIDNSSLASFLSISMGAQKFGLEFLAKISDVLEARNEQFDFMVSPFSVWALLLLLVEAAEKETLQELRQTLNINVDNQTLRSAFNAVQQYLQLRSETVDVASLQAMFYDAFQNVNPNYKHILETCYSAKVQHLQFNNTEHTAKFINQVVSEATRGLIDNAITQEAVKDANLVLTSTLYFKGQWESPFNKSDTRREQFYDENGLPIGEVNMMFQMTPFNYTSITELEGHVLELPYGNEDRLCMLVVLPKKGVSVNRVIHNLQHIGVQPIFQKLATDASGFDEQEVEVYLPKFTTTTKFPLRGILELMGIKQIFDPQTVDFATMSKQLFVQDIVHNTKIIVNEEGTEAAAATIATLANKISPPKFYFNRPFLYLIAEKRSNTLLFVGQVVRPNVVPSK